MPKTIHAATAMFPGYTCEQALTAITRGVSEPVVGAISAQFAQLCPQSLGHLSERVCEELRERFPASQLRLHANARVMERHLLIDASSYSDDTRFYFQALADRSRRLGATAYSVHAGYRENCTFGQTLDNLARIQDIFGPDCRVGVEGLYPSRHRPQLMDSWAEYEAALRAGVDLAIDLSHLNVVAHAEGTTASGLLTELLASPATIEVHTSGNDGRKDSHDLLTETPWWWSYLDDIHPDAVVFTEANQLRAERRRASTSAQPH